METNETTKDQCVIGKVLKKGSICVTSRVRMSNNSIRITGRNYHIKPQVLKVFDNE